MNALLLTLAIVSQCGPEGCAVLPTTRLVSVEVLSGNGSGSGTILRATRERSLVLTAAHMLRGRRLLVRALDGQLYAGRFLGRASGADLAALEITTPAFLATRIRQEHAGFTSGSTWQLTIAPALPRRIVLYGWGGENGRGLRAREGRLLESVVTLNGQSSYSAYGIMPQLGDSGGGAWSPDGYFSGVLTHRDGFTLESTSEAYVVRPDAVRSFLAQECCLLRAVGRALFGARPTTVIERTDRTSFDFQLAQVAPEARASSRIIGPPAEPAPMAAEELTPRRDLRDVPAERVQVNPNLDMLPLPMTNSVVVFQDNGNGNPAELARIRAELGDIRARMNLGITFAIPQLNGLQKRRTVHLGEVMGLEMNAQGPAMEAAPTAAPNQ